MHVVILEGSTDSEPVQLALKRWGVDSFSTPSVNDVCELVRGTHAPDVLLMQTSYLGNSAAEVVTQVQRESSGGVYILALINPQDEETLLPKLIDAGIDDYMCSPLREKVVQLRLSLAHRVRGASDSGQGHLRFMATHDLLTTSWNKGALMGHLYREVARAVRNQAKLAVAMCDIDYFKKINDTHGHLVGDDMLRTVAHRLQAVVRPYDIVGRYGGDEFVLLLPGCDCNSGREIAERARHAVASEPITTAAGLQQVTLSVGVADLDERLAEKLAIAGPEVLLSAADQAMYVAKSSGRNRVCVLNHEPRSTADSPTS